MRMVCKTRFVLFLDNIANMMYIFKSRFNAIPFLFLNFVLICWLTLYENEEIDFAFLHCSSRSE